MKYKTILIDWDDTIGDWKGAETDALHQLYHRYHMEKLYPSAEAFITTYETYNRTLWELYGAGKITKAYLHYERFRHLFLTPRTDAMATATADSGVTPDAMAADTAAEDFLALTNQYFRLIPGAYEAVRELAKHYPLTLLSNGFKEVQYYKLAKSGLKDCFQHILISEEVGYNKPQREIFEYALRLNGVSADQAVMIGDSLTSDIQGAKNASIDQIWITNSNSAPAAPVSSSPNLVISADPASTAATYIVPHLRDAVKILC